MVIRRDESEVAVRTPTQKSRLIQLSLPIVLYLCRCHASMSPRSYSVLRTVSQDAFCSTRMSVGLGIGAWLYALWASGNGRQGTRTLEPYKYEYNTVLNTLSRVVDCNYQVRT